MSLFARSKHSLETIAVDFLPFEEQLHLVVADADMNLQVLQFDPDSTLTPYHPPSIPLLMHSTRPQIRSRIPTPAQIHVPHRTLPRDSAHRALAPQNAICQRFWLWRCRWCRNGYFVARRRRQQGRTPPPNSLYNTIRHPGTHYATQRRHIQAPLEPRCLPCQHARHDGWTEPKGVPRKRYPGWRVGCWHGRKRHARWEFTDAMGGAGRAWPPRGTCKVWRRRVDVLGREGDSGRLGRVWWEGQVSV